jgi:hypothetical protein
MNLRIVQLKPNPAGKDLSILGARPSQLAAEWVDIKNDHSIAVEMSAVALYHRAYVGFSTDWKWAAVVADDAKITGLLSAGQTLRVHSGRVRTIAVIRPEDLVGADVHCFTGRDAYIWNNGRADTAAIWRPQGEVFVDSAEYAPQPPEGVVLVRSGDWLVPGYGATFGGLSALAALGGRR